jgi:hypothetical protein
MKIEDNKCDAAESWPYVSFYNVENRPWQKFNIFNIDESCLELINGYSLIKIGSFINGMLNLVKLINCIRETLERTRIFQRRHKNYLEWASFLLIRGSNRCCKLQTFRTGFFPWSVQHIVFTQLIYIPCSWQILHHYWYQYL